MLMERTTEQEEKMQPRIERRRMQCSRWLLYLVIVLSACALARLATAAPPPGMYRTLTSWHR
jgi:hypothetical protein